MSIIDIAGGAQPMVSLSGRQQGVAPPGSDGPRLFQGAPGAMVQYRAVPATDDLVVVVFNGCIYNHRELRAELRAAGHQFQTDHSDTEVLIHGWRQWGKGLPTKLEGMFAFAVWDHNQHSLLLARDHYGEKPLYEISRVVQRTSGERERATLVTTGPVLDPLPTNEPSIAFASTLPALDHLEEQARLWVRPAPPQLQNDALFGKYDAHRAEVLLTEGYGGVRNTNLMGGAAAFQAGTFQVSGMDRFWPDGLFVGDEDADGRYGPYESRSLPRFPFFGIRDAQPRGTLTAEAVEKLLRQAVARRVEADVPLGAFLSGGVDSSLVSLFAKEALGRLKTFCVRMPDARYDESVYAAQAAAVIGSDHTTLEYVARPAEDLIHLIGQLGMPFGDSSLLPTYWVSRAAREHVKVVLTGDGGDELFVGYERQMAYFVLKRWSWALALLPRWAFPPADPKSLSSKLNRLITAARHGSECLRWIFQPDQLPKLLLDWQRPDMPYNPVWTIVQLVGAVAPSRTGFSSCLRRELDYLTDVLLRKVDTTTMSVALESRAPFLDTDLAAAVHAANPLDLIPGGERKGLLKQVARKYFPAEVVDRPKMGFAIPIGEWFRSDYGGMKTLLLDHLNAPDPWPGVGVEFNRAYVKQLVHEHMAEKVDHSQRLYLLLVLSIWAKSQPKESVEAHAPISA